VTKREWSRITDGTAQDDRFPRPLDEHDEHFFRADERKFEDMISRSADFSKLIPFYNLSNRKDGTTWIRLFHSDQAVVMAEIVATDYDRMQAEFLGLLRQSSLDAARYVVRFAGRFDSWYRRLLGVGDESGQVLCRSMIDGKLRTALSDVREIVGQPAGVRDAASRDSGLLDEFHEDWQLPPAVTRLAESADQQTDKVGSAFYAFVHAVDSLKPIAAKGLALSMKSGDHDPSMGLFMAFAKLFDTARDKANLFTKRHRDFYYEKVLGMTPNDQVADSTFLVMQPEDGTRCLLLPGGTAFTAGKAGGDIELIYESDAPLVVTDARLRDLRTVHCRRDPLVSPEYQLRYINAVRASTISLAESPASAASGDTAWPLFGADKPGAELSSGEDADVGFAIAASALLLREGRREITVAIAFRIPGIEDLTRDKADPLTLTVDRVLECADMNAREAADFIVKQIGDLIVSDRRANETLGRLLPRIADGSLLMQNPSTSALSLMTDHSTVAPAPAEQAAKARFDLGRALRRKTLNASSWTKEDDDAFAKAVRKCFQEENRNDLLLQEPLYIFHRVFGDAFKIDVTVASGWYGVRYYPVPIPKPDATSDSYRLIFRIELGPEAPPIAACNPDIHGKAYGTKLPVLRFRLNPAAIVCPYSLLRDLAISEISIGSSVPDATKILAWNQQGQLDPTKPFNPFGPLPTTNSYLILGNYESAGMQLTSLALNLEWGDLPDMSFADYYRGYQNAFAGDKFVVGLSALRDGRWLPARAEGTACLFRMDHAKVGKTNRIEIDVARYMKPLDPGITEERFQYDREARDGFFRLALKGPEGAFGHAEYPTLLTEVLSENALASRWFRRNRQKLPNPPYTPVINRMSLSYEAKSTIGSGGRTTGSPDAFAGRVYWVHPFGIQSVETNKEWSLLPEFGFDGSLFIGFEAAEPGGVLTLLFDLCEDSATIISSVREPALWHYLASDRWCPLREPQILGDTTEGFLASGIVTLELPPEMTCDNTVMPDKLFWLRVSARRNPESFCSLYKVLAQAVRVTRRLNGKVPPVPAEPLPAKSILGPVSSVKGLRAVSQPLPSSGGQEPEKPAQMIERTSERLRHKYRASTPWDYERLILANFPDVFKVKCFSAMASPAGDAIPPAPGSVLVVVVPFQKESGTVFDPMIDAIRLKRIQEFLKDKTSPFAQVEVRNPVYERVQIVCTVGLTDDARSLPGIYRKRLNEDIVEYLSPWAKAGSDVRFGWSFNGNDVKAFIRKLNYVSTVTNFSMLHITQDEQNRTYRLDDTARESSGDRRGGWTAPGRDRIIPRYPWSLAIPSPVHDIELAGTVIRPDRPVVTGIGRMAIGNTFITTK